MATPNPEEELQRLLRIVAKPLPSLTLVGGSNDFFRAEAVDRLLAAVPKDAELRVVDAGAERDTGGGDGDDEADDPVVAAPDADVAAGLAQCPELQDLRGGGLFARTAFVVVRRGAVWWRRNAALVVALAPKFGKGCGLIVEAKKFDKRKKVVAGLIKALTESGGLFDFRDLYDLPYDRSRSPMEGELCKWVIGRAGRLGVPLAPDAAWLVVMQVGKQPAELVAELQRLRDRVGADPKRKPLSPADLRGKLTCSFEATPFDLADAVLGDDRRAAWRAVRAMFERGVRGKDGKAMDSGGVFPFATSWLHNQLSTLLEGRQLADSGVAARDLAARLGIYQFGDRFAERVQRLSQDQLRRGLLALHQCQRASRLTSEDADLLLERFLSQWFDGAPIPTAEDLDL